MGDEERYETREIIGRGSFGIIHKVIRKSDGHVLCRKEVNYQAMSSKEREQLQAELSILKGLRHPNVVAYYEREHVKASSELHIYMEYCEQGDLGRYIKDLVKSNKFADEDFVWSVAAQTAMGLHRCHNGVDPPEVGRAVLGLGSDTKGLKTKAWHSMILHRDLKPENIFLGADGSVKLGDFGLSKMMPSHTFANTYVGTPFYMSPEICAAENYSLHSDIWALGCILYELCSKVPPFNAKTHLELAQKIRLGKVDPLPQFYSTELKEMIARCLRVVPQQRPDTAQLLNTPMMRLKRKELEVVSVGRHLKNKEEQAMRKLKDAERRLAQAESEKNSIRADIDNTVRREWEVKARLEIDRQVQQAREQLFKDFETEVRRRVAEEMSKMQHADTSSGTEARTLEESLPERSSTPNLENFRPDDIAPNYHQSQSTTGEPSDFPSSTDLSELSLDSSGPKERKSAMRSARSGLARAQTMFDGSPTDVPMVDPSPAPIASLNLSPRRNGRQLAPRRANIFASAAVESSVDSDVEPLDDDEDDDDSDEIAPLPSPTLQKQHQSDPFKAIGRSGQRPGLLRQRTAPQKQLRQPPIFEPTAEKPGPSATLLNRAQTMSKTTTTTSTSPQRRIPKLPSTGNLAARAQSPHRRAPMPPMSPERRPASRKGTSTDSDSMEGRTLVELSQARGLAAGIAVQDFGDKSPAKSGKVTVWDPERDEMPSPFIIRNRSLMPGTTGGPGMRHLR